MTTTGTPELEDEIKRLSAESLALRTILAHMLARLSAVGSPDVAAALRRGLEDAERALKERQAGEALSPSGLAAALSAVETVKGATLRSTAPGGGVRDEPGAFHAESNDRWPEDDY
jgi:hypothetical protein